MQNIWNAARLDLSLAKPYIKGLCLMMLYPIIFVAMGRTLMIGVSSAMCFAAMATVYNFSITEKGNLELLLYGILPARKSDLVVARYLFLLAFGLLALVLSLLIYSIVLHLLGETVKGIDIVTAAISGMLMFLLFTSFQLPGYYKYGALKGRLLMFIPAVGFIIIQLLLMKLPGSKELAAIIANIAPHPPLLAALLLLLVAFLYIVSIRFSIHILQNKKI